MCTQNSSPLRLQHPAGPSFEFSSTPRFEKFFVPLTKRKLSKDQVLEINKRIKKNKIFSSVPPVERQKMCISVANRVKVRAQVTKITKNCLENLRKERIEMEISEKNKKYKLRLMSKEICVITKTWGAIIVGCGVIFSIKSLVANRSRLKKRNYQRILWIRSLFRAVGKIRIILKKIRARRSLMVLTDKFIPLYKIWNRKKKNLYKKCIFLYINDSLSYTWLYKLVCQMNQKCKFIQTHMKKCGLYKREIYKKLRLAWDEPEKEKNNKKNSRNIEKHRKSESFPLGKLLIPNELKDIIIRKFIKDKFKSYYKVLTDYFKVCKEIDEEKELNKWKVDCIDIKLSYPIRPNFPLFLHIFNKQDFILLRKSAINNKSIWDNLLENEKQKILKSY